VKKIETPAPAATNSQIRVEEALRLLAETSSSHADSGHAAAEQKRSAPLQAPESRNVRSEVVWWAAAAVTLLLGFSGIRWLQVASYVLLAATLALEVRRRKQPRGIVDNALGLPEHGKSEVRRMISLTIAWEHHLKTLKQNQQEASPKQ